jgi:hypothetical protein
MKNGNQTKGQATLEALLSLAVLLSAFALLMASAQNLGALLNAVSQSSSERYLLSYESLSIDTAASLPGTVSAHPARSLPSEKGNGLRSPYANVSQPVFHKISSDSSGNFYADSECCEPV